MYFVMSFEIRAFLDEKSEHQDVMNYSLNSPT